MARTISAFLGDQQDVHLDSRSSLSVATGLEDVRQRVVETLKLWRGEWFLDTTRGVPYTDEIFRRPAVAGLISSAISSRIRAVDAVTGVPSVTSSFDPATRLYSLQARVSTAEGSFEVTI